MIDRNSQRDPLEVLAAEFTERQRRGEHPSVEEYVQGHPELADDIRDLFPTIVAVEQLKMAKASSTRASADLGLVQLDRLGDFRIVREIGRGGMGIVYEAEQESLGRLVAVKVLPRQALLDPRQLSRFDREARTAAGLHHTNIVPIFGVGEQEGHHYFVMQLIDGVGLDSVIRYLAGAQTGGRERDPSDLPPPDRRAATDVVQVAARLIQGRLRSSATRARSDSDRHRSTSGASDVDAGVASGTGGPRPQIRQAHAGPVSRDFLPARRLSAQYWRSVADVGFQVADALAYAHAQGVLHRDVKPANLLIDAEGTVWVTDFGLAKALEHDAISRTGDLVGTLRYMAPEQFDGKSDARSDAYSLGLTLYELLTLCPAFDDSDRSSLIHRIVQGVVPRPRRINRQIPVDLETIVLKAIAREPAHRYHSAHALAADLSSFLEDRPIHARRSNLAQRIWHWSRRNPALACVSAAALFLLVAVALVATAGYLQTSRANLRVADALAAETTQRKKAEATSEIALEALDTIFAKFAPTSGAATAELSIDAGDSDETSVTIQPVLSKEAVALLEHMLEYYHRLADQGGDDLRIRLKVAQAKHRVGDIHQRLGDLDAAKSAYRESIDLYRELDGMLASGTDLKVEIAGIYNDLGNALQAAGEVDDARVCLLDAESTLEERGPASESDSRWRYELARTDYLLARRIHPPPPIDRPPHGPREPRGGGRMRQAINRFRPPDALPRHPPDGAEREPLDALGLGRRRNEHEQHLNRAIDLLSTLVADYPTVPDYRHLLARCYRERGMLRPRAGRPAEDAIARASEMLEELVRDFPDVPEYRCDLSETYATLDVPVPLLQEQDIPAVEDRLRRAVEISEGLIAERPNVPEYVISLVYVHHNLAHLLHRTGRLDDAEASLRRALALQLALANRFSGNATYAVGAALLRGALARVLIDGGQLHEARSLFEEALATLDGLIMSDPSPHRRENMLRFDIERRLMALRHTMEEMDRTNTATDHGPS